MKQIILCCVLLNATISFSCDVCGCAASINTQGVFADYSSHFIGLRYNHLEFKNRIKHDGAVSHISQDMFNRTELNARILLAHNTFITLSIPYLVNKMESDTEKINLSGFGDSQLMIGIKFPRTHVLESKHNLVFAAGAKLPFGCYQKVNEWGNLIHMNLQVGSGSFDFLGSAIYIFKRNNFSWINLASFKYNDTNKWGYRFGHLFNLNTSAYWLRKFNATGLALAGGLNYELSMPNLDNNSKVFNTGGNFVFAQIATQLFVKQCRIGLSCQIPAYSSFQTDNLTKRKTGVQFGADLIYFLGKKK